MADKVFVSYNHEDGEFALRLEKDLRANGLSTWIDAYEITHGDFMERMNTGLAQCQWLVLILTPHSLGSKFVAMEVNAALTRVAENKMKGVIPVEAISCKGLGIPPIWNNLHRYDATKGYNEALAGLLRGLSVTPLSPTASSGHPGNEIPPSRIPQVKVKGSCCIELVKISVASEGMSASCSGYFKVVDQKTKAELYKTAPFSWEVSFVNRQAFDPQRNKGAFSSSLTGESPQAQLALAEAMIHLQIEGWEPFGEPGPYWFSYFFIKR